MILMGDNQGLEPFEFIGIGSGTGSLKIKYLFRFGSDFLIKKKGIGFK